ncbi:MAG: efflux RND transporter periplasmic adaptor subunit [Bacteroidetes bacterium]|nr:efflux RND transporter periplasmic adaptor subunit [Bacteroidota bacterium]
MKKLIAVVAVLVILAGIIALLFYNKSKMEKLSKVDFATSIPVTVAQVTSEKLEDYVTSVGTLIPNREVVVGSEISGRLTGVYFEIGDKVGAGKTMAKVDDELRKYTLDNAAANFEKAKKDLERYEELFKTNSVTEAQLDAIRLAYKTTESALSSADKQYRDTWIKTSLTGIVTEKKVEKGTIVSSGTPVATVVDISSVKARINVPEADVFKLKIGDEAEVTTDVYSGETFTGKIININAKGDEAHTFPVEILIKNNGRNQLKAGMFVKASFKAAEKSESLVIQRACLVGSSKNPKVYVVENGIAKLRDITLGIQVGDKLEVLSGLNQNDTIVLDGQVNLKDGDPVMIVTQGSGENNSKK